MVCVCVLPYHHYSLTITIALHLYSLGDGMARDGRAIVMVRL